MKRSPPSWLKIVAGIIFMPTFGYASIFFNVNSTKLSYSDDTCVQQTVLFPDLLSTNSDKYNVRHIGLVKLLDYPLISTKTCFIAKSAPLPGKIYLNATLFNSPLIVSRYAITVPDNPVVMANPLTEPVSAIRPLEITLNSADNLFDYQIEANSRTATCPTQTSKVLCDIANLKLSQGSEYNIKLFRIFNNQKIATLINTTIKTINANSVTGSSIKNNQIIYDKPKSFTFDFEKSLSGADIKLEKVTADARTNIELDLNFNDKQVSALIYDDLEREASYEFTIDNIVSDDNSTLIEPYKLAFNTSGGPKVSSISADTIGIPLADTIVISLDQPILTTQDITPYISTEGISGIIYKNENQIFISYSGANLCKNIKIEIKAGLESNHNIINNTAWTYGTKTTCHTTTTIGHSVEGRSILAHSYGSGSKTILYVGNLHGNELSGKYLVEKWMDELENNFQDIPSDKRIVIIPTANPDGTGRNRRYNSNGVDLNRNFSTIDWQMETFSPTNTPLPTGGGSSPLSEPEAQAIAEYIEKTRPILTIFYHSAANLLLANEAGNSTEFATAYSLASGYRDTTYEAGTFSYKITGTVEGWMNEKCGLPAIVVELSSTTNSEYSRNKAAMWAMVK